MMGIYEKWAQRYGGLGREAGTSVVEYIGMGAVSTMLLSGIAAGIDAAMGDHIANAIIRQLIAVLGES